MKWGPPHVVANIDVGRLFQQRTNATGMSSHGRQVQRCGDALVGHASGLHVTVVVGSFSDIGQHSDNVFIAQRATDVQRRPVLIVSGVYQCPGFQQMFTDLFVTLFNGQHEWVKVLPVHDVGVRAPTQQHRRDVFIPTFGGHVQTCTEPLCFLSIDVRTTTPNQFHQNRHVPAFGRAVQRGSAPPIDGPRMPPGSRTTKQYASHQVVVVAQHGPMEFGMSDGIAFGADGFGGGCFGWVHVALVGGGGQCGEHGGGGVAVGVV